MKKHYFLTAILIILFSFLPKMQAQILPEHNIPFGVTGLSHPVPACSPTILVGYVNFAYTGAGATPSNWNISNITTYGPATQTITTNRTYSAGTVYNTDNYSIVKNPSTMTGGTFRNSNAPGGYFVTHNGGNNQTLVYTIRGLNSPADYFISTNDNMFAPLIYYVRIRMHNFGTQDGCNAVGNNIEITFDNQNGQSFSIGNQLFYDAGFNRGQNGRYMATNTLCSGGNVTNQSWGGWGQIGAGDTKLGIDGTTTVFEGAFGISAGRAGQNPFGTDDGFRISIKALDRSGDNIFGIESIEVYGCLPMHIEARDGLDPQITGNTFCENGPVDISATGAGFGNNIQWKKGETLATAVLVGTGHNVHITAPQGIDNSELYWVIGEYGTDTIRIYSAFCCSALGQTSNVFTETFPLGSPTTTCGTATISPLVANGGTTTYFYNAVTGVNNPNQICMLDEKEYAIANHSHWSFWADRTQVNEHTGTAGSGMMMVNAGAIGGTNPVYFYERQLENLCPNTQYEFSAWYNSIANGGEAPSDITFEIRDAANTLIESGSTGNFGGTTAGAGSFVWRKKSITFTSNSSSSFWVKLKNNNGATSGNDLLIDDISVIKCVPTLYLYQDGTNNTSITVCSGDVIPLSIELSADMVNLISANTGTVYLQLMSSTNQTTWTAVGTPQLLTGSGSITFNATPPASGTLYFRVKISVSMSNASDVNASLTNACGFNDVITQNFEIIRNGTMNNAPAPQSTPHILCSTYKDWYDFVGYTANDATSWGWALNDTTGMTYSTNPADKNFHATQNGTYYFVYTNGGCRAYKIITITDIFITPSEEVFDTICSSELPYDWRTHHFDIGQTTQTFTYTDTSADGCDINVTYHLQVYLSDSTEDARDICADLLPYRYNAFGVDTTFNTNTTSGDYSFRTGCSIHTLHLTISPKVSAGNPVFSYPICADESTFTITIPAAASSPNDVPPTTYRIEFDANSGFVSPQSGTIGANGEIEIAMPADIYPDNYHCKIILSSAAGCNELVFDADMSNFKVFYPNTIMQQKWNNVIALKNEYYNGGYQFAGYQWYRNGQRMSGETYSYIYLGTGNEFVIGDEYSVEITRAGGSKMFSCPLVADVARPIVNVVPTIVSGGGVITVSFQSPQRADARIYTVTGILLGSQHLINEINTINAPAQQGTYLLEILTQENQERQVVPIVVTR